MSGDVVMGIDPGTDGGVVVLGRDATESRRLLIPSYWMTMGTGSKKKRRRKIDPALLAAGMRSLRDRYNIILVVMEAVTAMPKQGVSSTFSFGRAAGQLEGIVYGAEITGDIQYVRPQLWKKVVLDGTDKSKLAAINYATSVFGADIVADDSGKPHDGLADAACMADYGWRSLGLNLSSCRLIRANNEGEPSDKK